jgi:hypothetical protein
VIALDRIPRREHAAGIHSLIQALLVNRVDYLTWFLTRLAATNSSHVDGFFPNDCDAT